MDCSLLIFFVQGLLIYVNKSIIPVKQFRSGCVISRGRYFASSVSSRGRHIGVETEPKRWRPRGRRLFKNEFIFYQPNSQFSSSVHYANGSITRLRSNKLGQRSTFINGSTRNKFSSFAFLRVRRTFTSFLFLLAELLFYSFNLSLP